MLKTLNKAFSKTLFPAIAKYELFDVWNRLFIVLQLVENIASLIYLVQKAGQDGYDDFQSNEINFQYFNYYY